jgi:hypothetical protein
MNPALEIRAATSAECAALGRLLVEVYSGLQGFPTQAMQAGWRMYGNLGFGRAPDLDFMQGELPVFGFRLPLT